MLYFYSLVFFVFGSCVGSFLNVVILRTHEGKTLGGRSECPNCHQQLATLDLIPIASYLFLGGKCRYCGAKLSLQYPLVELLTAIAFTAAFLTEFSSNFYQFLDPFSLLAFSFLLFILSVLVVVTVTDLRWGIIPDKIVLPAALIALAYQVITFLLTFFGFGNFQSWVSGGQTLTEKGLTPALVVFGSNLLTAVGLGLFFFLLIVVTKGKGMGGGDFKLSLFIGLSLGWPTALVALFLAFLTGALGSVMLLLIGKKGLKSSIVFGPFLAIGSFLALIFGSGIIQWYLKLVGL